MAQCGRSSSATTRKCGDSLSARRSPRRSKRARPADLPVRTVPSRKNCSRSNASTNGCMTTCASGSPRKGRPYRARRPITAAPIGTTLLNAPISPRLPSRAQSCPLKKRKLKQAIKNILHLDHNFDIYSTDQSYAIYNFTESSNILNLDQYFALPWRLPFPSLLLALLRYQLHHSLQLGLTNRIACVAKSGLLGAEAEAKELKSALGAFGR
jgi:hypothetical protein